MQRRKSIVTFIVSIALAALTGCASLPSPDVMKAEVATYQLPKLPEPGKAICYVVRPAEEGWLTRFNVFVDNRNDSSEMGYTRSSQYIYFNLLPGNHTIYSKAENWAVIEIHAKTGDIIFIQQETEMGVFMARNNLLRLKDYEGKYHVKTLDVGTILKTDK
jgi:hypothetical protein